MKPIPYRKHFAIAALALAAAAGAGAKTLVFCSEGSPENFYPGVNTTGTATSRPACRHARSTSTPSAVLCSRC